MLCPQLRALNEEFHEGRNRVTSLPQVSVRVTVARWCRFTLSGQRRDTGVSNYSAAAFWVTEMGATTVTDLSQAYQ